MAIIGPVGMLLTRSFDQRLQNLDAGKPLKAAASWRSYYRRGADRKAVYRVEATDIQSPLLRQRWSDMYPVVLGKVSTLSAGPDALIAQRRRGVRRASWLAGRVLLSPCAFSPLPEMVYGEQGKPAFSAGAPLWLTPQS